VQEVLAKFRGREAALHKGLKGKYGSAPQVLSAVVLSAVVLSAVVLSAVVLSAVVLSAVVAHESSSARESSAAQGQVRLEGKCGSAPRVPNAELFYCVVLILL
jgi:hypothetical protein